MALVVHLVLSIDDLTSGEKDLIICLVERGKNYMNRALQGITFLMGIPMGKYLMGEKTQIHHVRMQDDRLEEMLVGFHLLHRQGNQLTVKTKTSA